MRTFLLSICIFAGCFFCSSQTYLRKLIDDMSPPQQEKSVPIPVKSTIPAVFAAISPDTFIGISDPAMTDTLAAMNQAYARAIFMYALQQGKGRGLTDFFHDGNDREIASNYEELCELQLSCSLPLSQCSFEHNQLASGEMIVLLKVDAHAPQKNVRLQFDGKVEMYSKEISLDGVNQSINRISVDKRLAFMPSNMILNANYRYLADSRGKISIDSKFNETASYFDNYRYFYQPDDAMSLPAEEYRGAPVYHGLWYALMSDLFRQISKQFLNEQVRVKQVGDQYKSNLISLNRETGTFDFRVMIQRLMLKDNTLYVLLSR
ncbi:MAG: hypothetical protein Q7J05_02920 [Paludibacter sp.]|nr:hypothetical protein [Paludibacter sp.]